MYQSRLNRYQEKVMLRRLVWSVAGIVFLVVFLFFFGLKLIEGLGIVTEFLKGSPEPTPAQTAYVAPPILEEYPEATNSARIPLTGTADPGTMVVLYVNNIESQSEKTGSDGVFSFAGVQLADGDNVISAKSMDGKGNTSEVSNILSVRFNSKEPALEVSSPDADKTVIGDNNLFTVAGKTDPGNTVSVNGRVAVVEADGMFSYMFRMNEGENIVTVVARDEAGNEKKLVRIVTYHP